MIHPISVIQRGKKMVLIPVLFFEILLFSFASAETITYYGINPSLTREWQKRLGTDVDLIEVDCDFWPIRHLQRTDCPDLFPVDSQGDRFSDLVTLDMLEPFSPSEKMKHEMTLFPPIVQSAILDDAATENGQLLGYPDHVFINTMLFWVPEAWAASPYQSMTPPSSYRELLSFLEVYLETPHDGFCFCYDLRDRKNPLQEWMYRLIRAWVIQCRYSEKEIHFTDPDFVFLAEKTQQLGTRLLQMEPGRKKQKGRQLFTEDEKGYTSNGKDTYTWRNLIPWRIDADQPPLVVTHFIYICAKKDAIRPDHLVAFCDCLVDHRRDLEQNVESSQLYYLFINKDWIDVDKYNEKISKRLGDKWKCMYMTQDYVDSIWEIQNYAVPYFQRTDVLDDWALSESGRKLILRFLNADMSAETFAESLDQLFRQEEAAEKEWYPGAP